MKILILAAFFLSLPSYACMCEVSPQIEDVVKKADLILQGQVLKNYKDQERNYSVNRIHKVLKDSVHVRHYFEETFMIQTFYALNSSAACGMNLKTESGVDYIAIFPSVEKSEFGDPMLPLYVGLNICNSYLYILDKGASAETYRYIKNLLEK